MSQSIEHFDLDSIRQILLGSLYPKCQASQKNVTREMLHQQLKDLKSTGQIGESCSVDTLIDLCQLKSIRSSSQISPECNSVSFKIKTGSFFIQNPIWYNELNRILLSSGVTLKIFPDDIICMCCNSSKTHIYSFLRAKQNNDRIDLFDSYNDVNAPVHTQNKKTLHYFLKNQDTTSFQYKDHFASIIDPSLKYTENVDRRFELFSECGFLIKDVIIETERVWIEFIKIVGDDHNYTVENKNIMNQLNSNCATFFNKGANQYVLLDLSYHFYFQAFIDMLSNYSINKGLFMKCLENCTGTKIVIPIPSHLNNYKGISLLNTSVREKCFYWIDFIKTNSDQISLIPIFNYSVNFKDPIIIMFLCKYNNDFELFVKDCFDTQSKTKVVVPLAIEGEEFLRVTTFLTNFGMQYKLNKDISTCRSFNDDTILFEKNDKYPSLTQETALLIYDRNVKKYSNEFIIQYELARNEIVFLQSLVNKDKEHGGSFKPIKLGNHYFLVNAGDTIEGTEFNVNVPIDEVTFHVHPKYCKSKYKLMLKLKNKNEM